MLTYSWGENGDEAFVMKLLFNFYLDQLPLLAKIFMYYFILSLCCLVRS